MKAIEEARGLIAQFKTQAQSKLADEILDKIMTLVEANQCYAALKLVRRVMQHEAALPPAPNPPAE
jgi:flagellar protein FlbT